MQPIHIFLAGSKAHRVTGVSAAGKFDSVSWSGGRIIVCENSNQLQFGISLPAPLDQMGHGLAEAIFSHMENVGQFRIDKESLNSLWKLARGEEFENLVIPPKPDLN